MALLSYWPTLSSINPLKCQECLNKYIGRIDGMLSTRLKVHTNKLHDDKMTAPAKITHHMYWRQLVNMAIENTFANRRKHMKRMGSSTYTTSADKTYT
jgi:hypothetical protein